MTNASGHVPNRKRIERLQVMVSDVELKIIDAWRFEHRMPSRAAALRQLLRAGLEAAGQDTSELSRLAAEAGPVEKSTELGIV